MSASYSHKLESIRPILKGDSSFNVLENKNVWQEKTIFQNK